MSVWHSFPSPRSVYGDSGELVSVSVEVPAHELEELLEALAGARFPINPEIFHPRGAGPTLVEFPAYAGDLEEVRRVLGSHGFDGNRVRISGILESLVEA